MNASFLLGLSIGLIILAGFIVLYFTVLKPEKAPPTGEVTELQNNIRAVNHELTQCEREVAALNRECSASCTAYEQFYIKFNGTDCCNSLLTAQGNAAELNNTLYACLTEKSELENILSDE